MLKVASEEKVPQALCLTPTRELAKQIEDEIRKMGKYLIESGSVAVKCILREERYEKGFKMEQQIICGTAGKVWTLIQMRVIETSKIRVFVLDEADEMLAIGGQGDQSKRIKQKLNRDVQVLFFSATWTEEVIKFAKQIGGAAENWSQIEVQREHIFNDQTKQMFYRSKGLKEKEGHLKDLLNVVTVGQCIIFVNTRDAVDKLGAMLIADGHQVSSLHGKMDSSARDKVLLDFRSGTTKFLITTNILSRGIDVPAVTLVIQYDMPIKPGGTADPDTYLHRVGRTGRFGKKGFALNLVHDDREMQTLKRIETYFQRENFIQEVPPDSDADDFAKLLHIEV
jgi:ATP-dependent RNA helicase DDX19/DBP5